ncbi:PolyA_pol domain-containing protein/PolyA_pol_RNAbd domain-containing protein [Gossypium australe]|uniref:PolyA_pol domain-containing protein/PolyA_pol_RNAbd domain-containing protein n=1 Tax=Gossypium australe TaxID=47621 RepID=A0A5B6U8N1_9ROSI|nr:PolyA_pol domain-containing protein/PolyA_pol_RNAbd domain-containing protein [Gossypium australe]
MAISVRAKSFLSSSLRSLTRSQRCNHTLGGLHAELYSGMAPAPNPALRPIDTSKWKKIQASKVGISLSMISYPSWIVLKILHKGGFEAYLVGGCVRDLLLNRTPKDFDVITTANLKQIRKKFHRAEIIGKRFPICRVHIKGSIIEVSSFDTVARHDADKEKALSSLIPKICDEKDLIRWRNSRNRDFTINRPEVIKGDSPPLLMAILCVFITSTNIYPPTLLFGALTQLRTLIPAHVSFQEDCARILRGLRIAARLCLSFSKDTERAMYDLSASIGGLDKFRLMLEVNYMLSYGAAVQSICLLQRFNLLNILLPFQAAYISQHRATKNSMMLMKLFFNLDKLVSCDHPADSSLWVGLLMFHLALVNNPQDALVIWTFASVLYHGNWKEGVLTETSNLFESMSRYPFSPCSGLVFVPKITAKNTAKLFDLMVEDIRSFINGRGRMSPEINFHLLGIGDPCETRFVLGKIILETMKAGPRGDATEIGNDEKDLQPKATEEILSNNEIPAKKVKKHAPSSFIPDGNRGMLKKQKLVDENTATKNQEMVIKGELNDLAEKHQEFVKACKLSENKTNSMQGKISEKEEKSTKDKEKKSKKHTKVVEKSKHHIALHTVSKKQQKVVRELNLREEDEMDNLEKVLGKEEVKERTEEYKGRAGKERSGVSSLSSLFR